MQVGLHNCHKMVVVVIVAVCTSQKEFQCASPAGKDCRLLCPKDWVLSESAAILLPSAAACFQVLQLFSFITFDVV